MTNDPAMCRFVEGVTSEDWAYVTNRVRQMKYRCTNPAHKNYRQYGGRGIKFKFRSVRACAKYLLEQYYPIQLRGNVFVRVRQAEHFEKGNVALVSPGVKHAHRRPTLGNRCKEELIQEIRCLRKQVRRLDKENAELRKLPF
jgi:hypothetical protein